MPKNIVKSLLFIVTFTQLSCMTIGINSDKSRNQILARSVLWNEAFANKNMPELMTLFSPDAQLATAGGKWKEKQEGLTKFSSLLMKRPDLEWVIHPKEIIVNEAWEVAYERGNWVEWWSEPDGQAKITGSYFMMWKRTKTEPWLIHAAIFTPLNCSGESAYCRPHQK